MLAQSFKAAEDLGITEPQKDALIKTLVLLETGKLVHTPSHLWGMHGDHKFTGHFSMAFWQTDADCGTVCCIGGTAELIGGVRFAPDTAIPFDKKNYLPSGLADLFFPPIIENYGDITPSQAATALRSYLTTGDARWDLAVAG